MMAMRIQTSLTGIKFLISSLNRMRSEIESLCAKMAAEFPQKRISLIFWINNIDLVISILAEHMQKSLDSEKLFFEDLLAKKTEEFVQEGRLLLIYQNCNHIWEVWFSF